jgi:hypothetical protein
VEVRCGVAAKGIWPQASQGLIDNVHCAVLSRQFALSRRSGPCAGRKWLRLLHFNLGVDVTMSLAFFRLSSNHCFLL